MKSNLAAGLSAVGMAGRDSAKLMRECMNKL